MNRNLHRLVFNARLGMRVAVGEHTRSSGKAAGGSTRAVRAVAVAAAALLGSGLPLPALAQAQPAATPRPKMTFAGARPTLQNNLPRPMTRLFGSPGTGLPGNQAGGNDPRWVVQGSKATFHQGDADRVVLDWDSFDIGSGFWVHFSQKSDPTRYVSALNRVWGSDPSVILGTLTADREVILVNARGVHFGSGAHVRAGKFVASTLGVSNAVFERGIRNVTDATPVFNAQGTDYQPTDRNSSITVEPGAEIRSAAGGDVLLVAPRVANAGRIETPEGQTVLSAGERVYLMSSADPAQRGLIVAVDPWRAADNTPDMTLGKVENAADGSRFSGSERDPGSALVEKINEIRAERGTVNLVGLAVRQDGVLNATTAVRGANGAVFLQAMRSTALPDVANDGAVGNSGPRIEPGARVRLGDQGGVVELGSGSRIAVMPQGGGATQFDAEVFNPSVVEVQGARIQVAAGSQLQAPGGRVTLRANERNPVVIAGSGTSPQPGQLVVESGAQISVAGLQEVPVSGSRNQGSIRLFRAELADVPLQRSGPLYREEVFFDLRDGTRVTAANVAGASASIRRGAQERSTTGGSLLLEAEGALVLAEGARLDVSGGSLRYSEAVIENTLVTRNGRSILFAAAGAGTRLDGVSDTPVRTRTPAYTEGKDGGTLTLTATQMLLGGAELKGQVAMGERQQAGLDPMAKPSRLVVGQDNSAGGFPLRDLQLVQSAAAAAQSPLLATPPGEPLVLPAAPSELSLAQVAGGGFGSLGLFADAVTQSDQGRLDLGDGGALQIRANRIALDGSFAAAGGSINLSTQQRAPGGANGRGNIELAATSELNVAGRWTNNTASADAGAPPLPAQTAGGSVSVQAAHSLLLDPGAVIDVSGGALLGASGSLSTGRAGSLLLASGSPTPDDALQRLVIDGAQLKGYDFGAGGSLVLRTPALTVLPDPAGTAGDGLVLQPGFFSSGGFGSINVQARGDVRVAAGSQISPVLRNWRLGPSHRSQPSGRLADGAATAQVLDERLVERKPVNLTLAAARTPDNSGPVVVPGSSLVLERGAGITLEPGARLDLTATYQLEVGARGGSTEAPAVLQAPGGDIRLAIVGLRGTSSSDTNSEDFLGFLPEQALWLGPQARLNVSGVARLRPASGNATQFDVNGPSSGAERLTGTVLGGGSITLEAQRGYVIAEAGTQLSLDGAAARLSLPGTNAPVPVARSAGTLRVSSPEGFVLDAQVSARAPADAQGRALADGGRLVLSVGQGGVFAGTRNGVNPYPGSAPGESPKPREIVVGDFSNVAAVRSAKPGDNLLPALDNGMGYTPSTLLAGAGFGALTMGAGDRIRFERDFALQLPMDLGLETPMLAAAPGVQVALSANYLSWGPSGRARLGTPADTQAIAAAEGSNTTLALSAANIGLFGSTGLQGFSGTTLNADGEVRLHGAATDSTVIASSSTVGGLNFAGTLNINAGQMYAASAVTYEINGLPATDNRGDTAGGSLLRLTRSGDAALPQPLSAFGAMVIKATDIEHDGVLRQPFGNIQLQAERGLSLGAGSITSVSGERSVLFGTTINQATWNSETIDTLLQLPRAKAISLRAGTLTAAPGAEVNATGGGDVLAWEFFPGVGGSTDVYETPGLYAVLPHHAGTAPLPASEQSAADRTREIVITMPGSGLAPGRYTLWPARYALLEGSLPGGAFLVSRATDQGRSVLDAALQQDDGSVVVSGYMTRTGAAAQGVPGERFVVQPSATFRERSEVRLTNISDLQQRTAERSGLARVPDRPRDAGRIELGQSGTESALWQADTLLQGNSGRPGQLDVTASALSLLGSGRPLPEGAFAVQAGVINSSGAASVLLGGQRTAGPAAADGSSVWTIDAAGTRSLSVDLGTQPLAVQELLLAARERVELADNTTISSATGTATLAQTFQLSGDGALLALGTTPSALQRTNTSLAGGLLNVGAGSLLTAPQLLLDATGRLDIDPSARLAGSALDLGAPRIVVGEATATAVPVDDPATRLAGQLLDTAKATASLTLRSYSSIDFAGNQLWPTAAGSAARERLVLDTPALRALPAADGAATDVRITAADVVLQNTSGRSAAAAAAPAAGTLQLQAQPPLRYGQTGGLTLGPGNLQLGFADTRLASSGDIVLQGNGNAVAAGDLTLAAARVTATSGAQQAVSAPQGLLTIDHEPGARTLGERVGAGATVAFVARQIEQLGHIELPAGDLRLQAAGGAGIETALRLAPGSTSSVAGFVLPNPTGSEPFITAGRIEASAAQGRIEWLGSLDASSPRGDAGSVTLRAAGAEGELVLDPRQTRLATQAGPEPGSRGGRLQVDVQRMADASPLATVAGQGGATGAFALRARSGDTALNTDVRAQRIELAADGGSLNLGAATLDASQPAGGVVELMAGGNLTLSAGASIDARSARAGANGGDVLLATTNGRIQLDTTARVDAGGDAADNGRIVLRAQRGADGASVNIDPLNVGQLRAAAVDIEAVRVYSTVTAAGLTRDISSIATGNSSIGGSGNNRFGVLGQTTVRSDNTAFMNGAGTVLDSLTVPADERGRVRLRAGVEVRAAGDLTLTGDWALNGERPGGEAGFLTLRAAGNLTFNGSLSDGFTAATTTAALSTDPRAWSYRVAAGADLLAADPLATLDLASGTTERGNLVVNAGRMLRTGAGSIELAAGRDIRFSAGSGTTAQGLVYVAGRRYRGQDQLLTDLFAGQSAKPTFTEQGGRLELTAQRDVVSAEATQLVNNWLWRSGLLAAGTAVAEPAYVSASQSAWWTEFSRFRQTLGSFGGGSVSVSAGRDVINLQAVAPSAGWADARVVADATVQRLNGADVTVEAGRDLLGGQFFAAGGQGRLSATRSVAGLASNSRVDEPMLAMMNGAAWQVQAAGDVTVGPSFNPTAAAVPSVDGRAAVSGYYYSWGDGAAVRLRSAAGDTTSTASAGNLSESYGLAAGVNALWSVYAPSLSATAAGGDVRFGSGASTLLFSSPNGQLALYAGGDLQLSRNLGLSDQSLAAWPGFERPVSSVVASQFRALDLSTNRLSGQAAGLHADDPNPVQIYAAGSITATEGLGSQLFVPKPAIVVAGEDINGLRLFGQNLRDGDTTLLYAGRNFLAGNTGFVELAGPGALDISAGTNVELGASAGIVSVGNAFNPDLSARGASISVQASRDGTLDLGALERVYLQRPADGSSDPRSEQYRNELLAYVRDALKSPDLDFDQAWRQFQTFPGQAQRVFATRVLALEFGATYLAGPTPDTAGTRRELERAFETNKAHILQAGEAALAAGTALLLPGREALRGEALAAYLGQLRSLNVASLDLDRTVENRTSSRAQLQLGWRERVAQSLGSTTAAMNALLAANPQDPAAQTYTRLLTTYSGALFEQYRREALQQETASAAQAASDFGRLSLPMRLALFDQGFRAAELAGLGGSFEPQAVWPPSEPLLRARGGFALTQSSIVTERGGDITLLNAGGGISVGLKQATPGTNPRGVVALGGGDIYAFTKEDFQVNTQRVFLVGEGNMTIWSSSGDIDSGRGANTAVAAPPLTARRTADGVVFELPSSTTGSGLGILPDRGGRAQGTIGLFPAFGEILALDAFIRAPSLVLGSAVRGADNLQAASVGGAAAPVSAPTVSTPAAPAATTESRAADTATQARSEQNRPRNALLTVELLGLGAEGVDPECEDKPGENPVDKARCRKP
jgi:filamentous hemagglutinin